MVQELLKLLNSSKAKFLSGNWTISLKELLRDFAHDRNLEIAANGIVDDNEGEYMFDIVLYEMHSDGQFYQVESNIKVDTKHIRLMKSARMVIESEVSQMIFGGLKVDFSIKKSLFA